MARRATAIDSFRQSSSVPLLLLDAGGTLFGQALAAATKGQVIVDAMNAMGYDAMAVGEAELSFGWDVLQARVLEARFAVLSCNLVHVADETPVFTPWVVIERGGTRFGIIGVSEAELGSHLALSGKARVLEPLRTVAEYLAAVQAQSDVIIVLSHMGYEMDVTLAQTVPGIQLIVGGRSRRLLITPEIVGSTVLVQAGYDGEWLGWLNVSFDQGQPVNPRVEIVTLGPEVADQPAMVELVDRYRQQ